MTRFTHPPRRGLWRYVTEVFKAIAFGIMALIVGFGMIAIWLLLATAPILVVLLAAKYLFF